jgi:hypothetical protein
VILTACDPIYLLSVRKEDGGSITAPKVLGKADFLRAPNDTKRFVHGVEFPQQGADRIMLAGGETNFQPTCDDTRGAFATFLVRDGRRFTYADQIRPVAGNYVDGNPPQAPITSAARCTGSSCTRASRTVAWSRWRRTRTGRGS